jgi:hypothetical protein
MTFPRVIQRLWDDLEAARADVLSEVAGLAQAQADWRPREGEWSVGEVIHHLTIAEVATGKLTTKLTREAEAAGPRPPFPADYVAVAPLPPWPAGPAQAPPVVWPEHGQPLPALIDGLKATRARSRQSIERLATVDPRRLVFKHFRLGDLDLAQWWALQVQHDRIHLGQLRDIKRAPGFPGA